LRRLGAALALAFVLLGSLPVLAQELSLSLAAGGFRATNGVYREMYGGGTPWAADVWLKLKGPVGLTAGFGRLRQSGAAVPLGEGEEEYPLRFVRTSIPVTVFWQIDIAAVDIRLGAGLAFHSFREDWRTVELSYEGRRIGPRACVAATWAIMPRISFFGSAAYDSIPTGAGSLVSANVNLGGFQFMGGLSIRIF
jgi:hypothetical protein